jgi:hypothetical protein
VGAAWRDVAASGRSFGRRVGVADKEEEPPNGQYDDDDDDGDEEDNFSRLSFLNASLIPGQN